MGAGNGEGGKVEQLRKELASLRRGRGLRKPGRLKDCPLLLEIAATICRQAGGTREPLLDAMRVLSDTVEELPEREAHIFKVIFALGEGHWPEMLTARRSDLALELGYDVRTMSKREDDILATIAYKVVEREQQAISAETESQSEKVETVSSPDISVTNVEATIVLNEHGRPTGRQSSFTVQALRAWAEPLTAILEFNIGEFGIDDTVNCTTLNPHDYFPLTGSDSPEDPGLLRLLENLSAQVPGEEGEGLRDVKMIIQKLRDSFRNLLQYQRELRQVKEEISAAMALFEVSDVREIDLPPLEVGKSLTLSYRTSYPCPLDSDLVVSLIYPDSPICTLSYQDPWAFMILAKRPISRVKLRIISDQPLTVLPHVQSTGNPDFSSMPVIPFGRPNTLKRTSDVSLRKSCEGALASTGS